jgi:hypothetical protein
VSEYIIWLVIFGFYLGEHLKFVDESVILVGVNRTGVCDIIVPRTPYVVHGKQILLVPPFKISTIYTYGRIVTGCQVDRRMAGREIKRLLHLRKRLGHLLLIEPIIATWYFVTLPLVTYLFGILIAIFLFVSVQLMILSYFEWKAWNIRVLHGDKSPCRLCLALEMLIAPGIIPALSTRLALTHTTAGDAPHSFLQMLPEAQKQDVLARVQFRIDDMLENDYLSGQQARLYLDGLGTAHDSERN